MDRADNNRSLKDWDALVADVAAVDPFVRSILTRTRFGSGQKVHRRGELAEMDGTPGPSYNDPTGEDAVWNQEIEDTTRKAIAGVAKTLHNARVMLEWVQDLSSTDVKKRAKLTVPNCLACDEPCHGRVRAGFDTKCFDEWVALGRPDRLQFINTVKQRMAQDETGD